MDSKLTSVKLKYRDVYIMYIYLVWGGIRRDMKKNTFGKILVIGLIILFAGASVLPSFSATNVNTNNLPSNYKTPIEPLFEGESYFLLLSDYTDGAGTDNEWSVQLKLSSYSLTIESDGDYVSLPLILDEWVEIRVEIDLDGDWMEIYYNDTFLVEKAWTDGPDHGGTGELNIGAVDLYANLATPVYYDDLSLEQVGTGVVWSENFDSYADGSSMHGQGGWKGWDNDPSWTAYVTSAQARSSPQSVNIAGDSDLVHEYSGYTSGDFIYTAYVYIPSDLGDPPSAPTINGPTTGTAGTSYDYKFSAVDPDGDDVKYHIIWDDGYIDVTDFDASGAIVTVSHIWTAEKTYVITAYAEDAKGLTGPETTLSVTMPRDKTIQTHPFLRFLQNHQNLFPILRQLLGL